MTRRAAAVSDAMLTGMAADAARVALTRPRMVVVWVVFAVVLLVAVASLATTGPTSSGVLSLLFAVVFPVLIVVLTVTSTRRALRGALPVGSTLVVDAGPDALHLESVAGTADIAWRTFRDVRVARSTVLLRQRSGLTTLVSRSLLDDADIALIRERVGAPSTLSG